MTTAVATPTTAPTARDAGGRTLLACGVGGLAAYLGAVVLFRDPLAGSASAEEAARALDRSAGAVQGAALLLAAATLLLLRVVAELGARTAVGGRASARLVVPLGVVQLLLLTLAFWSLAGATAVGRQVFGSTVTPTSAEVGLVALNTFSPLAALVAAAFFAVLASSPELPRPLRISAVVLAVGLVLPMTGWAFLYVVPVWLAATGVWAARTARA